MRFNHWIYTIYKKYYFQGRFSLTRHILVICHTWECFIDRRTAHLTNIVFWFSVSTPFYNLWFLTSQYFSLVELWLFLCSSLYSRKLFQPQISCKWHAIYISPKLKKNCKGHISQYLVYKISNKINVLFHILLLSVLSCHHL